MVCIQDFFWFEFSKILNLDTNAKRDAMGDGLKRISDIIDESWEQAAQ